MKPKSYLLIIVATVLAVTVPATASVVNFTPRISVNEEYTDNVDLTDINEEEDFITTVSPGFSLEALKKHMGVSLNYTATYAMYKENSGDDTFRHNAGLSFWADLAKNTHLTIQDSFSRTEEPLAEADSGISSPFESILVPDTTIRRGRHPYSTNATNVDLSHRFGEKDVISLGYTYSFREDEAPDGNDNKEHAPHISVSYWFTPQYGIDMSAAYTRGEFDASEDYDDWQGTTRLSHSITKHMDVFVSYRHTIRDFRGDVESDYVINEPSVGFYYKFSEDMGITLGTGYFYQDREGKEDEDGYTLNADINKTWTYPRGSIRLTGGAGLDRNESGSENLGLERFYDISCGMNYALAKHINTTFSTTYRRNEVLNDDEDRIDDRVSFSLGLSYSVTRWLLMRLNYAHNLLRSDLDENDYDENKVTFGFTIVPPRPYRYLN